MARHIWFQLLFSTRSLPARQEKEFPAFTACSLNWIILKETTFGASEAIEASWALLKEERQASSPVAGIHAAPDQKNHDLENRLWQPGQVAHPQRSPVSQQQHLVVPTSFEDATHQPPAATPVTPTAPNATVTKVRSE